MDPGYNWFLILVSVIIVCLCLAANVYVLIYYQHPDDKNQAWIPKIVVVLGLALAMITVLMFPLDVANRAACSANIVESACRFTMPMEKLWFAVFISNLVLVWAVIPFTVFWYEGDSD
jgi:LMBR1 domain-containing protein 1